MGDWLSKIIDAAGTAYNGYSTQAQLDAANDRAKSQAKADAAKTKSYTSLIIIGGGVLALLVVLGLVFRRK